jgi:hypothetical protein
MKVILESKFESGAQTYILKDTDGKLYWNRVFKKDALDTTPAVPLIEVSDWNVFKFLYLRYYRDRRNVGQCVNFLDESRRLFFNRRPNAYGKSVV